MEKLTWFYPQSIDEVSDLLKKYGVIPHGGGTFIGKDRLKHLKGLISLDKLGLDFFNETDETIEIGATMTFSEVSERMRKKMPDSILVKSIGSSLSTALRNRVTTGGSIASFPIWSDLMGPLIALDAKVSLVGEEAVTYKLEEYLKDKKLHKGNLIKSVRFKKDRFDSFYYRFSRTNFDRASFNISMLLKKSPEDCVEDLRVVVVGTKNKYNCLDNLRERVRNKKLKDIDPEGLVDGSEVNFSDKKAGSAEYLKNVVCVEIERGLRKLIS